MRVASQQRNVELGDLFTDGRGEGTRLVGIADLRRAALRLPSSVFNSRPRAPTDWVRCWWTLSFAVTPTTGSQRWVFLPRSIARAS
jgi:hypothetical protein